MALFYLQVVPIGRRRFNVYAYIVVLECREIAIKDSEIRFLGGVYGTADEGSMPE